MNVMDKVKDGAQSARQALGIEQKEPDAIEEISSMCPKLSYQQVRAMMRIESCLYAGFVSSLWIYTEHPFPFHSISFIRG